jgi:hypothetical protein
LGVFSNNALRSQFCARRTVSSFWIIVTTASRRRDALEGTVRWRMARWRSVTKVAWTQFELRMWIDLAP